MSGIIVSGGTYSGSGDVTAEFFKATGTSWDVTLTNGVTELYGELPSGETLIIYWGGDSNAWKHNNGTVKFTNIGTRVNTMAINPTAGAFYNVIVNNNADGRGVNGVQFVTAASGAHLKIANNLTVTSGAAWTTQNSAQADYLLEVLGHCLVQESGAALFGDASFMNGGYNATRHGLLKVASLQVNENGYFSASSGTTGILGAPNGGYSMYIPDGGFYHSSGTVDVRFTGTDASQVRNKDDFYNYEQTLDTASYASARVNWRGKGSAPYQFTIANNLTIKEGAFRPTAPTNTIVVSGNVDVETGGTYGFSSGDFEAAASFGSVYNLLGTMYLSTGTTTITGPNTEGYLWRTNGGTFYHNNGLVYITTGAYNGVDVFPASTQHFYDLTYSGSGTVEMYGCTIDNDFDVGTDITFRPITPTQAFTVSGTATMSGFFGKDGYPQTVDNTFGSLNIKSGGTYYATTGTTTLKGNFTDDGTFTHNSGSVTVPGGVSTLLLGASNTAFYDIKSDSVGSGVSTFAQYTDKTVEHDMITGSTCDLQWRLHQSDRKLTLGTDSYASQIDADYFDGDSSTNQYVYSASELFPAVFKSSIQYIRYLTENGTYGPSNAHIKWLNIEKDITTAGGTKTITLDGDSEFEAVTIAATDNLMASGQRVTFGGTMTAAADGLIVSGALVEMTGAGNWSEGGYQEHMGRDSASVIWNSTGFYSPNGGYLNYGWRDVLWNTSARINQDGPFRGSNLIVAGGLDANNRAIGTSGSPPKIIIANGGTVSSSTNVFHASTFSNRGGLFASSSAVFTDGVKGVSSQYVQAATFSDLNSATASTMEVWFKVDNTKPMDQAGIINPLGNNRMQITISSNPVSASGNYRLGFEWENGGTEIWNSGKVQDWDDTKWHHAAMTCDDTDGYKLYFDGKLEASGAALGNSAGSTVVANPTVMVGGQNDYGYINRAFAGTIARASIWDTALTSAQIRTMLFQDFDTATTTDCVLWWQFDEGEGGTVADKSGQGNTGTLSGTATNTTWANAGTWTGGNKLGSETGVVAGNIYIGNGGVTPTVFGSSYFPLANRRLISGSKFASKSHLGTTEYYIATSGTNDWLNYQKLEEVATIGALNDLKVLADGSNRSYFNFDSNANNEQCNTFVNAGYIRIVDNADFYTQDFDNSQGIWERGPSYDGIIHDDGSTPHEYEPIDLMDDQDSNFDTSELID